ncbi:hypothetical protein CALVIDRAFT_543335 [Calocera viscosa TUFC12733]|uniref:F-box domain-containing protein n=1 Tax=Calocera viscosa (strain TUFC12733) TaxID=1330018 RepID=A0A167FQ85_CALVF|nr:hypothetical protein CALVIDRAFT_543335 [Calocera viscosa TUFC12733]
MRCCHFSVGAYSGHKQRKLQLEAGPGAARDILRRSVGIGEEFSELELSVCEYPRHAEDLEVFSPAHFDGLIQVISTYYTHLQSLTLTFERPIKFDLSSTALIPLARCSSIETFSLHIDGRTVNSILPQCALGELVTGWPLLRSLSLLWWSTRTKSTRPPGYTWNTFVHLSSLCPELRSLRISSFDSSQAIPELDESPTSRLFSLTVSHAPTIPDPAHVVAFFGRLWPTLHLEVSGTETVMKKWTAVQKLLRS